MSQLSLFGAMAREPALSDVEGLLAGNGQVVRRADAARVSVVLSEEWRVAALAGEMHAALGMEAEIGPAEAGMTVGTPWLGELRATADAWFRGAVKCPPAGWTLDGSRLRWWCLASGWSASGMYSLALGANDEHAWLAVGSALSAVGVPGVLVGPRADGPAYRIVGRRRLTRLVELIGDRPEGVPQNAWPEP
ncbi:MAG TPA: hypothetical protein VHV76_02570 [Mycobacteriales bacterium]|nr:hypothetical protein [Mycobacteriales bacterium]